MYVIKQEWEGKVEDARRELERVREGVGRVKARAEGVREGMLIYMYTCTMSGSPLPHITCTHPLLHVPAPCSSPLLHVPAPCSSPLLHAPPLAPPLITRPAPCSSPYIQIKQSMQLEKDQAKSEAVRLARIQWLRDGDQGLQARTEAAVSVAHKMWKEQEGREREEVVASVRRECDLQMRKAVQETAERVKEV